MTRKAVEISCFGYLSDICNVTAIFKSGDRSNQITLVVTTHQFDITITSVPGKFMDDGDV